MVRVDGGDAVDSYFEIQNQAHPLAGVDPRLPLAAKRGRRFDDTRWLLIHDGQPVGAASHSAHSDFMRVSVGVLPEWRGRGFGARLADIVLSSPEVTAADTVYALADYEDASSAQFAQQRGFTMPSSVPNDSYVLTVQRDATLLVLGEGYFVVSPENIADEAFMREFAPVAAVANEDTPELPIPEMEEFQEDEVLRIDTGGVTIGVRSDGVLVGLVQAWRLVGLGYLYSEFTLVAPSARRAGFGEGLKRMQREWAARNGISHIVTDVPDNPGIHRILRKLGYRNWSREFATKPNTPEQSLPADASSL